LNSSGKKPKGLALRPGAAQREVERLKARAVAARNASEASLAGTRQALEQQRQRPKRAGARRRLAQREIERLKTRPAARNASETSLARIRLELERRKVGF
jgi:hypothetical protein